MLETTGRQDKDITDVTSDSRQCSAGSLFIAIDGFESDGHAYIRKAAEAGACAAVYSKPEAAEEIASLGLTGIRVADSRAAAADIAGNFFGHPSRQLNLVGVTGTNGKTTIATLLYRLFSGIQSSAASVHHSQLRLQRPFRDHQHHPGSDNRQPPPAHDGGQGLRILLHGSQFPCPAPGPRKGPALQGARYLPTSPTTIWTTTRPSASTSAARSSCLTPWRKTHSP